MKIRQKLVLGFAGIASIVGIVGAICITTSQRALQKAIGKGSAALAAETIDKIDREIYHAIEDFQAYCTDLVLQDAVAKSNREFEKLENVQDYIDERDAAWVSAQEGTTIPLVQELTSNKLSEELRERIGFHERSHGYKVFGEVFVTNRYGANVALTRKTSDYRQDDEQWWQKAREDGFCVGDVEYDESAGAYSIAIAIRADDEGGSFAGVVKIVLSIEEVISVVRKAKEAAEYETARFKLLNKDGDVIFDEAAELKSFDDVYDSGVLKEIAGDSGYLLKNSQEHGGKQVLLAYARSQGHNSYEGLGWIVTVEFQTAELFAPVVKSRNIILVISLVLTICAVITGLIISNYISRPLSKLRGAMDKIGKGDLGIRADVRTNDEIGQLAGAFNQMVEQRKQAEEALGISEGRLNAMLRAIADDVAVIDNDLNIIWTNDVAKEIFGDDIVGQKCYKAYHRRNKPCEPYPCPTLKAFQDGKVHQYETQVTDKDGKSRYIHCVANVALRGEDGKPTAVLEICRDITQRKLAEDRLEKINTCLLSLGSDFAENVSRITSLLGELFGATCALYRRLEQGMLCSLGQWHTPSEYNPRNILPDGHICYDVIQNSADEVCVVRDLQNSTYARSDPNVIACGLHTYVGQAVNCNGHHVGSLCAVFQTDFEPSEGDKKIIGILASAMRVEEERRQAEEVLEELNKDLESANLELTRVNKELQEFAYITAHDLKTPLRAMGILADWISTDYADKFDDQGKEQVSLLTTRAKQMSALVDNILQFSRLGQNNQDTQRVDLNVVLSEVIAGIDPPENIEIATGSKLPRLVCERTHIIQVLQNLLSNAVKYMNKPGGQIAVDCVEEDDCWRFSVADNGPGIEEKHFERIFKIFQTLSPRDGVESTGIGLSIVKKLVELNRGRVWVESELGEGSTFYFTLPKQMTAQNAERKEANTAC
jgi:PAS domain S-box-containing protein